MGVTHVDQLSDEEKVRFNEWADKWIEIGLRTGPADREKFEHAVRDCYRFAGIEFPDVVVWVPSPLVLAFAAPAAAVAIEMIKAAQRRQPLSRDAVGGAVGGAVDGAVDDAVDGAVRDAVMQTLRRSWSQILGGQFWVGGWWWSPSFTSFFREVCKLELPGDLWERGRAYEATAESACWWWPHRRFVMVCERPVEIYREFVLESQPRGWGSHRLHREDGPAVVWPDGWGVWSVHGTRVPRCVVEAPETLTADEILSEENAEVRRVMIDRFGAERLLEESDARALDEVHEPPFEGLLNAKLYRLDVPDDEPIVMVKCRNSSPEPDGSYKDYWLRVDPRCRSAHEALAWTWGMDVDEYRPLVET